TPNEVVFTPSLPAYIEANGGGCYLEFDVRVEADRTNDSTPLQIEQRAAFASSASCANGESSKVSVNFGIGPEGHIGGNPVTSATTHDIFAFDGETRTTERMTWSMASDGTEANGPSFFPAISRDGRFVAFESLASNLVANDRNDFCSPLDINYFLLDE